VDFASPFQCGLRFSPIELHELKSHSRVGNAAA
jgi:hypothetical protein